MENETKTHAKEHEDAALKLSMQFFASELLPYFGIEGKVVSITPTELVQLEIHKLFQDYNLVMEDGTWKHFEFQSTNGQSQKIIKNNARIKKYTRRGYRKNRGGDLYDGREVFRRDRYNGSTGDG